MDPFAEGSHYGPVLEPFLVKVVGAQVKVNPLLQPLPEDGSDQMHLKWNMIFPTSTVQRSSDPSHVSWSKGRDAPATFPRITALRLVSTAIPWMTSIKARNPEKGLTCGEVIDAIGYDMSKFTSAQDFKVLSAADQKEVTNAYRHHRSRSPGVPGGAARSGHEAPRLPAQEHDVRGDRRERPGGGADLRRGTAVCVRAQVLADVPNDEAGNQGSRCESEGGERGWAVKGELDEYSDHGSVAQ
ncbi:hypothetical protein NLJ89_g11370 [Agrocybe chaxingu]|uniref:DUF6699 domain-containing protein n=1 Tax=Agrocybe chaxingu TaxID=84603 RepID=A0A9W8JWF2_9AGAR|nr:hypothetical protein NLJ89_g11370 [Agrocybe chaxingu]